MSRFLGPIHYWLFNKIKLYEDLEGEVISKFKKTYEEKKVEDILATNIEKHGEPLADKPLEEIIDTDNIHGWLQSRISVAETRQAAILGDLFNEYSTNGVLLAKQVYERHGIKCGEDARTNYQADTAEDIYKIINNYVLDGMPCDNVKRITKSEADYLEYKQVECLHIGYWNKVGVKGEIMYDLRTTWTQAFVNTLNPEFKYQVSVENIGDQEGFCHKIFKK